MGFGVLLFGYGLYLNTVVPIYTVPVAGILTAFGLRKLKIWNSGFRGAFYTNFAVILFGLVAAGLAAAHAAGADVSETLFSVFESALYLLVSLYHFYLGSGIVSLSGEVGLSRLSGRAFFFRTIACIYWFLFALFALDLGGILAPVAKPLLIAMVTVGFVVSLVGLAVLFSCYTDIGMPEDNGAKDKTDSLSDPNRKNGEDKRK